MRSLQNGGRNPDFEHEAFNLSDLPQMNSRKIFTILKHRIAVQKALEMIEARVQDPPTLGELASFSGLSPTYFSNVFKEVTRMRLQDYLIQTRLDKAKNLLSGINLKVKQVACEVGFSEPNYFCRTFKKKVGLTPTNWRLRENSPVSKS